ncbi:uncharacterized protein LOC135804434 [Sycon ciliatum]|uniref:uncharacterized protein LOC135804434 n=1 Tax=Sycon ciliatum TaxID=27933 RepID=UPI0031F662D0
MTAILSKDSRCNRLPLEKQQLVTALKEAVQKQYGEEDDFLDDATCRRYLAGYKWSLEQAQTHLMKTLRWRADVKPETWTCEFCLETPGQHSMRQIGFDRAGRTVLYTSFVQCASNSFSAEESVRHMVFLLENGVRSMQHRFHTKQQNASVQDVEEPAAAQDDTLSNHSAASSSSSQTGRHHHVPEQWVVVLDCTGMTLAACNPRIASAVTAIIGNHYPERLGTVVTLNAGYLMRYAWAAIKVVLPATMASKLQFINSEADYRKAPVCDVFDEELREWVREEERLNRVHPLPDSQRNFWKRPLPPAHNADNAAPVHDPRGTPSYVRDYVEALDVDQSGKDRKAHQPHPNIIQDLAGRITTV